MEVVDTSALILARGRPELEAWIRDRGNEIAILDIVAIEFLMGARTSADYTRLEVALSAFPSLATEPADWARAREVHRALAAQGSGYQRSVRIPDLLIAAVAERVGLGVAHYDEDYDRIATVSGQRTRWVLPRGSV